MQRITKLTARLLAAGLVLLLALPAAGALGAGPSAANPYDPDAPLPSLLTLPPVTAAPDPAPAGLADGYALGRPDAPVTVEVWGDFQCPYCRAFTLEVEPRIIEPYVRDGRVRLVFHHLAFLGEESRWAAVAADLAREQGRFHALHALLYANQLGENIGSFSLHRLWTMAELAGLDLERFAAGMELDAARARWASIAAVADEEAARLGIRATPTVIVNGTLLPSPDPDTVLAAIEVALASLPVASPSAG